MAKSNRASVYFDRASHEFVGLDDAHLKELKEIYKHVDVDMQFRKMKSWLVGPRGKKHKGTINFIIKWLDNSTPCTHFPTAEKQIEFLEGDSPLRALVLEYLGDLWKGREHLLNFNTVSTK